jgi:hypothetical protein
MNTDTDTEIEYWARANGIKYMGPYETEQDAWRALMTPDDVPAPGACVWIAPKNEGPDKS